VGERGRERGEEKGEVQGIISSGFKEINFGVTSTPLNHSSAVMQGELLSTVGTKTSS